MTGSRLFKSKTARVFWFLAVAAIVVGVDQFSKAVVIHAMQPGISHPVLGGLLGFYLVYNDSAAFSLGFGLTWLFTGISTLAALALLWYGSRVKSLGWALLTGLALGGVTGNLVDRLFRSPGFGRGQVVDFIQIPFNFPIFNLADSAICVAAAIVVIQVARGRKLGG